MDERAKEEEEGGETTVGFGNNEVSANVPAVPQHYTIWCILQAVAESTSPPVRDISHLVRKRVMLHYTYCTLYFYDSKFIVNAVCI